MLRKYDNKKRYFHALLVCTLLSSSFEAEARSLWHKFTGSVKHTANKVAGGVTHIEHQAEKGVIGTVHKATPSFSHLVHQARKGVTKTANQTAHFATHTANQVAGTVTKGANIFGHEVSHTALDAVHKIERTSKNFGHDVEGFAVFFGNQTAHTLRRVVQKAGHGFYPALHWTENLERSVQHAIENTAIDFGTQVLHAESQVLHDLKYAGNKTLHGLRVAEQASYKGLVVFGEAVAAGTMYDIHMLNKADAYVRKYTGGMGILDVLSLVFPEAAVLNAVLMVAHDPKDWQAWASLATCPLGEFMLVDKLGMNETVFALASDLSDGSIVSATQAFIMHPSIENAGTLVSVGGQSATAQSLGDALNKQDEQRIKELTGRLKAENNLKGAVQPGQFAAGMGMLAKAAGMPGA